jgi:hypothetical protein
LRLHADDNSQEQKEARQGFHDQLLSFLRDPLAATPRLYPMRRLDREIGYGFAQKHLWLHQALALWQALLAAQTSLSLSNFLY